MPPDDKSTLNAETKYYIKYYITSYYKASIFIDPLSWK